MTARHIDSLTLGAKRLLALVFAVSLLLAASLGDDPVGEIDGEEVEEMRL